VGSCGFEDMGHGDMAWSYLTAIYLYFSCYAGVVDM